MPRAMPESPSRRVLRVKGFRVVLGQSRWKRLGWPVVLANRGEVVPESMRFSAVLGANLTISSSRFREPARRATRGNRVRYIEVLSEVWVRKTNTPSRINRGTLALRSAYHMRPSNSSRHDPFPVAARKSSSRPGFGQLDHNIRIIEACPRITQISIVPTLARSPLPLSGDNSTPILGQRCRLRFHRTGCGFFRSWIGRRDRRSHRFRNRSAKAVRHLSRIAAGRPSQPAQIAERRAGAIGFLRDARTHIQACHAEHYGVCWALQIENPWCRTAKRLRANWTGARRNPPIRYPQSSTTRGPSGVEERGPSTRSHGLRTRNGNARATFTLGYGQETELPC